MSNRAITRARKIQGINPAAKAILILLADSKNETTGQCFPSIPTLVSDSCLSESGVKLAIRELEAAKLIKREFIQRQNRTLYHLLFDVEEEGQSVTSGGSVSNPRGGQSVTPNQKNNQNLTRSSLRSEGTREDSTPSNVVRLKQKTRLTEAFTLTAERLAKGVAKGLSEEDTRHEFGKFQDHFIGNGVAWVDWDRCWSKWLSTAVERGPRQAAYGGGRPQAATFFHATRQAIARVQAARGPDGRDEVDLPF